MGIDWTKMCKICTLKTRKHCKVKWSESGSVVSNSLLLLSHSRPILHARILEWVAFPFSGGSSQPRDGTHISGIAGRFFTSWATRDPRILEWIAYPFSSRCSWPRNRTGVSCIAGGFFTNWAIREAHLGSDNSLVCEKVGEAVLSMVGCLAAFSDVRITPSHQINHIWQPNTYRDFAKCPGVGQSGGAGAVVKRLPPVENPCPQERDLQEPPIFTKKTKR